MKCLNCKKEIKKKPHANNIKFCSIKCRTEYNREKNNKRSVLYQREKRGKYALGKIKCEICGKYYNQVGTHIVQIHKITAREYRKLYGFDISKGQLADWLKEIKREYVFKNNTIKNLEKGIPYRFKKGQKGLGKYERSEETMRRLKQKNFKKFNIKKNV